MARHVFEVRDADGAYLFGHGRGAWKQSSGRFCAIIPETLKPGRKVEIGIFCLFAALAALPELVSQKPAELFRQEMQIPDAGKICGILFNMTFNRSGCYRLYVHIKKSPRDGGLLWRHVHRILQFRNSMHLNTGQGFYFTPKLPFIAFALLLAEVRTGDRLPHLERPIQNSVLPMQQWMIGYIVPTGLVSSNYFCCC